MTTPPDTLPDDEPGDGHEQQGDPLRPPYELRLDNAPQGGWSLILQWNYSVRYPEIESFSVNRQRKMETEWEVVAEGLSNLTRTYLDMVPDDAEYTYTVTAYPLDGSGPLTSEPPRDAQGKVVYAKADIATTVPRNIRKPLRSTSQKMFIAWDYHSAASSYILEAINEVGASYMTVHVTDVYAPFGLFVGEHPSHEVTARVTIMRRHPDGSEYAASSAENTFFVDDIADPHFAVLDIQGQKSESRNTRSLGYSVVLGLAEYGMETAQLTVNGVVYEDVWIDHDGHWSATVETCYPAGGAVTAAMRIAAPDNFASGS